jgi:hypothetical protein
MTGLKTWVRRWSGRLPRHLGYIVDVDVIDSPAQAKRRQRVVSAVHLLGTGLLGASLSTRPGSVRFYALTFSTADSKCLIPATQLPEGSSISTL